MELDLPAATLGTVADSLFSHFAANAGAAAEGHAQGRTRLAGEIQLHQHRLLDLLLAVPPRSAEVVAELAWPARWWTPETVAVVVVPGLEPAQIRTADHFSTLLMFQNEDLLTTLTGIRLAPLELVRPGQRDRLAERPAETG